MINPNDILEGCSQEWGREPKMIREPKMMPVAVVARANPMTRVTILVAVVARANPMTRVMMMKTMMVKTAVPGLLLRTFPRTPSTFLMK
jgi:hypothetical protein